MRQLIRTELVTLDGAARTVDVWVDTLAIAARLGAKAMRNKPGATGARKTRLDSGNIEIVVRPSKAGSAA
jgi:hypothetical protein